MASYFNSSFFFCYEVLYAHCVGVVLGLQGVRIKAACDCLLEPFMLEITSIRQFCIATHPSILLSTTTLRVMAESDTETKTGTEYGPVGYIYHLSSRKPIGRSTNRTELDLVVYNTKEEKVVKNLQFRFVRVKEFGHFGYIEHVESSKVVHPTKDNKLVLCDEKNVNALFTFDLERYTIIHRNGRHWHINGDNPTPDGGTACLLQKYEVGSNKAESKDAPINDSAKFYFGKIDAHHLYPYSSPNVSHDWKLLQAFITPETSRSFEINYKVGWVKEFSETVTHAWKISADVALYSFLKSSGGYNGSISLAETGTLTKEKSVSLKIDVQKGHTVCVWQRVYCFAEFSDKTSVFLSNIICDTESLKKPDVLCIGLDNDVRRV